MKTLAMALPLLLVVLLAPAGRAELRLAPQPGASEATCAEFLALDIEGRVAALRGLSMGGALGAADPDAARAFSEDVANACRIAPDALLRIVADRAFTTP